MRRISKRKQSGATIIEFTLSLTFMIPLLIGTFVFGFRLVQALGLSFTVSTVTLALALYHAGEMHMALAWPSLVALATALASMWLGQIVRGKVREQTFRLWFFLGMLALGGHLALRGLL